MADRIRIHFEQNMIFYRASTPALIAIALLILALAVELKIA